MGTRARSRIFEFDQLGNRMMLLPRGWKPEHRVADKRPCHPVSQVLDRVWKKLGERHD